MGSTERPEKADTVSKIEYRKLPKTVAESLPYARWDVPRRNQGQIVEVAYSHLSRFASEADRGDELKRVYDRSDCSVEYYERVSTVELRGSAFGRVEALQVRVGAVSGVLGVWDSVAGHYTTCHSLTPTARKRALALAS